MIPNVTRKWFKRSRWAFIKNLIIIFLITILISGYANCTVGKGINPSEEDFILISWTFENESKRISAGKSPPAINKYTADKGNGIIDLIGAVFGPPHFFTLGAGGKGTYAAHSDSWDNGSGKKYWQITIATEGYKNLKLSSKQKGSKTGPRDFKVQYSLDGNTWHDVAKSSITISESFTSGFLKNLLLPKSCEDLAILNIRWVMNSNSSIEGGIVGKQGTNRIDDIIVTGEKM